MSESDRQSSSLRERGALMLEAFNATAVGSLLVELQGAELRVVVANTAFFAMTGLGEAEVVGQDLGRMLAERVSGFDPVALARVVAQGASFNSELLFGRPDGSEFWVELTLNPITGDEEAAGHGVAVMIDVSRRKSFERRLSDHLEDIKRTAYALEQQQAALDEHAIVSITDTRGVITYANRKFCEISGYSERELVGQNHRLISSGRHPREFFVEMWRTIAAGDVWHGQVCNRRKDGSLYWVDSTIVPFYGPDDQPYQYVSIRTDITPAKEAEEARRISEERLRRGQAYANIGMWDWNIRTGELYWSERIAPLFGFAEGELETTYENFLQAVHPLDRQRVVDAVEACVERGADYRIEHRVVWPDGTVRWLLEMGDVQRAADGSPLHMLGVVQDVTERKLAQFALEASEQHLKEAQSIGHMGNWSWDVASGRIGWSDEIYRIFGYQPGAFEPTYERFFATVHPDDVARVKESEQRSFAIGEKHSVDHRIIRPDGSVRWVHEEAVMLRDADGRQLSLSGTVQDVTERKLYEEELGQYRRVIEASEQAIGVAALDGALVYVNPAHERLFGYSVVETLGRPWTELVDDPDGAVVQELRESLAAARAWSGILWARDRTGRRFPLHSTVGLVNDDKGMPTHAFNIMYDFSAEQARQQELQRAKEEAEAANRAKSEFLSRMSHELRTPMNAILGFAQLLESDPDAPLNETQVDSVQHILKAGWHLLELINEVLDLTRIDAGRIELCLQPVAVDELIGECVAMINAVAAQRAVRIEGLEDAGCSGALVQADRTRLKQVLLNLLSNAVKYNREGGTVSIRCRRPEAARLRIEVEDTGPGVAEGDIWRLFEPFDRLGAEQSSVEGTGIGLNITRRLVELMGGELGMASRVGAGSRFWVDLLLATDAGMETDGSGHAGAEVPFRVFYVEPDGASAKLMAQMLLRHPTVELKAVKDTVLARSLLRSRRPDLIVLGSGIEPAAQARLRAGLDEDGVTRDIPLVALVADAESAEAVPYADAVFAVPLDQGAFLAALERLIAAKAKA